MQNVIHIGRMGGGRGGVIYFFLRKVDEHSYKWFQVHSTNEEATSCSAKTIPQAIQLARKEWKDHSFRTLHCGFKYSLPVRDEVGCNALFWEMAASYSSSTGQYFDTSTGQFYFVDNASEEALELWRKVRENKK